MQADTASLDLKPTHPRLTCHSTASSHTWKVYQKTIIIEGNKSCVCDFSKVLNSFRYAVMSECWLEKLEDRSTFRWICTAMSRLINDHEVHKQKAQKEKKIV